MVKTAPVTRKLCIRLHTPQLRVPLCYTRTTVNDKTDIRNWYEKARSRPVPKIVTGLRGIGKSGFLEDLYNEMRSQGVSRRRVRLLDSSAPEFRRFSNGIQTSHHLLSSVPPDGPVQFLLREAAGFPDPEFVMATLARNPNWDVVATSSSRRLISGNLQRIYNVSVDAFEVLPKAGIHRYSEDAARARWNEIFLKDVLANTHVMEVMMLNRVSCWLSDNLGEAISLRIVANAISPGHRAISPHTVGSYLDALVHANVVGKALRWDTEEETVLSTGYRYFFTDPDLRLAQFGPAPKDEKRRMALNRAWLWLRHEADEVYTASGLPEVDFVTRNGNVHAYWHVDVDGDGACVRLC